jgi:hypothetical protein
VKRLAILVLILLTACGSTVQLKGTTMTPGGDAPELGTATSGTGAPPPDARGGSASSTDGPVVGTPGTGSAAPGQADARQVPTVPVAPPGMALTGRGWDAKTVAIGVVTNQDIQRVASTVGVNTLDSGDQHADAEAMIAELNTHGGLFGRTVHGVYYDVKTSDNRETAAQAVCTYFTQDHPVIALIDGAVQNDTDSFRACMAKAQTLVLGGGAQPFDDDVFQHLQGWYYQLPYASWSDLTPALVSHLKAAGWFTSWNAATGTAGTAPVKVGLLALDTPVLRRITTALQHELTRAGEPGSETFFYATNADIQAAVLRFRADGVTHVISTDQFLFTFMENAESQRYRPRYGISTPNAPSLLLQGTVPAEQLNGALGLGFFPSLDVDGGHDPGSAVRGSAGCRDRLKHHGVTYASDKRFAQAYGYLFCDAFDLLRMGATKAGGLSPQQMRYGVAAVGSSLQSSFTFRNALSPSKRNEPGAALPLRWDTGCTCFRYGSGLVTM